jgi:ABC-type Mn2+/Zn2+ transport system permease subunit
VIERFVASFELFGTTYLVGLASAALLALVGVWVVARNRIFLGAAVSQASTLGVAAALWLAHVAAAAHLDWLESPLTLGTLAVSASVATAWLAGRGGEARAESAEEVTGWVFLLAASVPVLLMAHSAHGLEEIERLMFSTLLSASRTDLVLFLAIGAVTVLATVRLHHPVLLFAMDPELAEAVGLRLRAWNAAMAVWLGVAVGLSIRTGGTLYTFGCLVLPALIAKNLCREVRPMLLVSPAIALAAAFAGFLLANELDLPPAHATVSLLCLALPVAWALRARVRQRAVAS